MHIIINVLIPKKSIHASHTSQQENTYSDHGILYFICQWYGMVQNPLTPKISIRKKQNIISENRIATDETIAVQVKLYSLEQKQDNSQTQIMPSLLLQEDVLGLAITKT